MNTHGHDGNLYGHDNTESQGLPGAAGAEWGGRGFEGVPPAGPHAWSRAALAHSPAQGLREIPLGEYAPTPRLMGGVGGLLAEGETVPPCYYALESRSPRGLLCVPSAACGSPVIALYDGPADAVMARRDWFRRQFSEVPCVADFPEVARVRPVSRADALAIRRAEAAARGEALPPGWPNRARRAARGGGGAEAFWGRLWPVWVLALMLLASWIDRSL